MGYRSNGLSVCAQLVLLSSLAALSGCGAGSSANDSTTAPAAASTVSSPVPAAPTPTKPTPAKPAPAPTPPTKPTPAPAPAPPPAPVLKPVSAFNSGDACLAAPMPSSDTLFNSPKRVFAHYFHPFPLSIDNNPAAKDYYNAQYLSKTGESNKWLKQGGYLSQ